jgi:hypothetical protein
VNGRDAPLQLRADQPGVTFYLHTSSSSVEGVSHGVGIGAGSGGMGAGSGTTFSRAKGKTYARICTAPCEATIPAGSYDFALSKGKGDPVPDDDLIEVPGPATVQGRYTSYFGLRVFGTVVTIGSVIGGIYILYTAYSDAPTNEDGSRSVSSGKIIAGFAVLIGGSIIGSLLSSKSDEAEIRIIPGASGSLSTFKPGWMPSDKSLNAYAGDPRAVPGMTLQLTFLLDLARNQRHGRGDFFERGIGLGNADAQAPLAMRRWLGLVRLPPVGTEWLRSSSSPIHRRERCAGCGDDEGRRDDPRHDRGAQGQ